MASAFFDAYAPLTEPRVVKELIRNRWRSDSAFIMRLYETDNPVMSNGTPSFDEDIICLYIDLDAAIAKCGLSDVQLMIVTELMKGYTASDIAENCFPEAVTQHLVTAHLTKAVHKITGWARANNAEWAANAIVRKRLGKSTLS